MRGNNYQIIKNQTEDEIIRHIDTRRRVIRSPHPIEIGLRVSIMEIIAYKAALTGRAIKAAWA
jgi:hypothetical protein